MRSVESIEPIYKAIVNGDSYTGRAYVVDTWYFTIYTPLYDSDTNKIIGAAFTGKPLLSKSLYTYLKDINVSNDGYFFLYDFRGEMILHPTMEGVNIYDIDILGDIFKTVSKEQSSYLTYTFKDTERITYAQYIPEYDWYLAVGIDRTKLLNYLNLGKLYIIVGITSAIILSTSIVVVYLLLRSLSSIIKDIVNRSAMVAEGDYTVNFPYDVKDTLGELSSALNMMVGHTRSILLQITDAVSTLSASTVEIVGFSDDLKLSLNTIAQSTTSVKNNSSDVSSAMQQIAVSMEQASTNLTLISSSTEEMTATITEISTNTERARNFTTDAVTKASQATESMTKLEISAHQITSVIDTIATISSQTNLLALNATIEAARAGASGKGFAVVANEIKELAKQASEATSDIRIKITNMVDITNNSVDDITTVTTIVSDINEIVSTIAAAVEEQTVTTKEISDNLSQVGAGITDINSHISLCSSSSDDISTDIQKVHVDTVNLETSGIVLVDKVTVLNQLWELMSNTLSKYSL